MAGNLDGNILGTKPVIGSKSDGMGQGNADGTVINLLKRLQNSLGLGSFGFGFDGGFNVYSSEAIRS